MQLPQSLSLEREQIASDVNKLKSTDAQMRDIVVLERKLRDLPHDPEQARFTLESSMFVALERISH